jgi:hypothetical protein
LEYHVQVWRHAAHAHARAVGIDDACDERPKTDRADDGNHGGAWPWTTAARLAVVELGEMQIRSVRQLDHRIRHLALALAVFVTGFPDADTEAMEHFAGGGFAAVGMIDGPEAVRLAIDVAAGDDAIVVLIADLPGAMIDTVGREITIIAGNSPEDVIPKYWLRCRFSRGRDFLRGRFRRRHRPNMPP